MARRQRPELARSACSRPRTAPGRDPASAFIAYARHGEAATAFNERLAALYTSARLAPEIRGGTVPAPLQHLWKSMPWQLGSDAPTSDAAGESMRRIVLHLNEQTAGGRC